MIWWRRRRFGTGAICTACDLRPGTATPPGTLCFCLVVPWQVTR